MKIGDVELGETSIWAIGAPADPAGDGSGQCRRAPRRTRNRHEAFRGQLQRGLLGGRVYASATMRVRQAKEWTYPERQQGDPPGPL